MTKSDASAAAAAAAPSKKQNGYLMVGLVFAFMSIALLAAKYQHGSAVSGSANSGTTGITSKDLLQLENGAKTVAAVAKPLPPSSTNAPISAAPSPLSVPRVSSSKAARIFLAEIQGQSKHSKKKEEEEKEKEAGDNSAGKAAPADDEADSAAGGTKDSTRAAAVSVVRDNKNKNKNNGGGGGGASHCPMFSRGAMDITSCVDESIIIFTWAAKLLKEGKKRSQWTIVDVGANKGYTIVGVLAALGFGPIKNSAGKQQGQQGHQRVSRTDLAFAVYEKAHRENKVAPKHRHHLAGACCDALESPIDFGPSSKQVPASVRAVSDAEAQQTLVQLSENVKTRIFAYDGLRQNADFVRDYLDSILLPDESSSSSSISVNKGRSSSSSSAHHQVVVKHAAVSYERGTAQFLSNKYFGSEFGSLELRSATRAGKMVPVTVNVKTLDDEMTAAAVDYIDILITDTEGSDFKVAAGSMQYLLAGRVGLYMFELHALRPQYPRLSTFIVDVLSPHFECFFPVSAGSRMEPTTRRFIPISPPCYYLAYDEIRQWANVICANKKETELLSALRDIDADPATASWVGRPEWSCPLRVLDTELFTKFPNATRRWASHELTRVRSSSKKGAGKKKNNKE